MPCSKASLSGCVTRSTSCALSESRSRALASRAAARARRLWLEICAAVLGIPIERTVVEEGSAFGAALLGGGRRRTSSPTCTRQWRRLCERTRSSNPTGTGRTVYAELRPRFRALYPALRGHRRRYGRAVKAVLIERPNEVALVELEMPSPQSGRGTRPESCRRGVPDRSRDAPRRPDGSALGALPARAGPRVERHRGRARRGRDRFRGGGTGGLRGDDPVQSLPAVQGGQHAALPELRPDRLHEAGRVRRVRPRAPSRRAPAPGTRLLRRRRTRRTRVLRPARARAGTTAPGRHDRRHRRRNPGLARADARASLLAWRPGCLRHPRGGARPSRAASARTRPRTSPSKTLWRPLTSCSAAGSIS